MSETVTPTASTACTSGRWRNWRRMQARVPQLQTRAPDKSDSGTLPADVDRRAHDYAFTPCEIMSTVPPSARFALGRRGCTHAVEQVIAHAQRVGHDRQRRIHRAARREEAAVHDVEVVDFVRPAVDIERRGLRDRCRSGSCRSDGPRRPAECAGRRTGCARTGPGGIRRRGSSHLRWLLHQLLAAWRAAACGPLRCSACRPARCCRRGRA